MGFGSILTKHTFILPEYNREHKENPNKLHCGQNCEVLPELLHRIVTLHLCKMFNVTELQAYLWMQRSRMTSNARLAEEVVMYSSYPHLHHIVWVCSCK